MSDCERQKNQSLNSNQQLLSWADIGQENLIDKFDQSRKEIDDLIGEFKDTQRHWSEAHDRAVESTRLYFRYFLWGLFCVIFILLTAAFSIGAYYLIQHLRK
ncbi:unnamed protein product, partial [Mesorhabditis belari]|uniref:Uncharacterized protein n=1 Tax=Mesorhabditis belari TaxID=2138241 RepID=A0AAF3EC95_9BILA